LKDEEIYEGWNWKKYLISLIILNKKNELRPNLKENNLRGWFDFLEDQHKKSSRKDEKTKKTSTCTKPVTIMQHAALYWNLLIKPSNKKILLQFTNISCMSKVLLLIHIISCNPNLIDNENISLYLHGCKRIAVIKTSEPQG
jgi:hypothetical protein